MEHTIASSIGMEKLQSQVFQRLLEEGRITHDDLRYVQRVRRSDQKKELVELLVDSGIVSEKAILGTVAEFLESRFWSPSELQKKVKESNTIPESITEAFVRQHLFVPLALQGKRLHIVVSRLPTDVFLKSLRALVSVEVISFDFATKAAVATTIFQLFRDRRKSEEKEQASQNTPPPSSNSFIEKTVFCDNCGSECKATEMTCPECNSVLKKELAADPLPKGKLVGPFQIESLIAKGGTAEVYRSTDLRNGQIAAVKLLQNAMIMQRNAIQRFQREGRALRNLKHPGIVELYEIGFQDGLGLYMATELLDGREFLEILQKESPLSVKRLTPLVVQICDALSYAHNHEVIHRDLKPDNIILLKPGPDYPEQVKLIDFGLAKELGDSQKLTQEGMALGTPRYMSPQQVASEPLDFRTDIYSLGVIVFEALTGRPLFDARGSYQIMLSHLQAPPPKLTDVRPDLTFPPGLIDLLQEALAKKLRERPQSMEEFRDKFLRAVVEYGVQIGDAEMASAFGFKGSVSPEKKKSSSFLSRDPSSGGEKKAPAPARSIVSHRKEDDHKSVRVTGGGQAEGASPSPGKLSPPRSRTPEKNPSRSRTPEHFPSSVRSSPKRSRGSDNLQPSPGSRSRRHNKGNRATNRISLPPSKEPLAFSTIMAWLVFFCLSSGVGYLLWWYFTQGGAK